MDRRDLRGPAGIGADRHGSVRTGGGADRTAPPRRPGQAALQAASRLRWQLMQYRASGRIFSRSYGIVAEQCAQRP